MERTYYAANWAKKNGPATMGSALQLFVAPEKKENEAVSAFGP
jgi:hypothetical protein